MRLCKGSIFEKYNSISKNCVEKKSFPSVFILKIAACSIIPHSWEPLAVEGPSAPHILHMPVQRVFSTLSTSFSSFMILRRIHILDNKYTYCEYIWNIFYIFVMNIFYNFIYFYIHDKALRIVKRIPHPHFFFQAVSSIIFLNITDQLK